VVRSKHLLTNCQRAGKQSPGIFIIALRFPEPGEIIHGLSCLRMLKPQFLFADV
jgi:hypothetical protein